MNPLLIGPLFDLAKGVIDRVFPDEEAKRKAEMEFALALSSAEAQERLAQIEVNKAEAATDKFRGGWRPFAGWTCGLGLFYEFLLRPLLPWFMAVIGVNAPPLPPIDSATLMTLLLGMLGLGGLRSYERIRGVVPPGR